MNRRCILAGLMIVLLFPKTGLGQQPLIDIESGTSLFSDNRGYRVGDVITIMIRENTVAVSNARTQTDQKVDIKGGKGVGPLGFIPLFGLDTDNRYRGDGTTERLGQIRTEVTARIVEVLPNRQYKIEGKRRMKINGEQETVVLTGVIRARDIRSDNRILSTKIADATIAYQGRGIVEQAQKPGWITRIVNWIF